MSTQLSTSRFLGAALLVSSLCAPARAQSAEPQSPEEGPRAPLHWAGGGAGEDRARRPEAAPLEAGDAAPFLLYTHSAFGTPGRRLGAQTALGGAPGAAAPFIGNLTIYGSPIEHLTLLATGERRTDGRWAPSASAAFRILGGHKQGWALGALGTYKTDGFASVEGEVELGALFSWEQRGFHADVNAVAGGGLEAGEELDAEGKLRLGYDVLTWLRLGIDGRVRHRLDGPRLLAGNRKNDAVGGAEAVASFGPVYVFALAGATSVDVARGASPLGWLGVGALAL